MSFLACVCIYIYIYIYMRVIQKVQILDLLYTSHLCMGLTCTEIKTGI